MADDERIQRWVLGSDRVLVRAVAMAVGVQGLAKLVGSFKSTGKLLSAARVEWAAAQIQERALGIAHEAAALALIKESCETGDDAQQLGELSLKH